MVLLTCLFKNSIFLLFRAITLKLLKLLGLNIIYFYEFSKFYLTIFLSHMFHTLFFFEFLGRSWPSHSY